MYLSLLRTCRRDILSNPFHFTNHRSLVGYQSNLFSVDQYAIKTIKSMESNVTEPPIGISNNLIMEHTTASAIATAE